VRSHSSFLLTILVVTAILMPAQPVTARDLPLVFVSIPPLKFVVERLAADAVAIEVLLPPGASPHTYEPTPRQMADLDRARIYLAIGVPFEKAILGKISAVIEDLQVVDCRVGVTLLPVMGDADHHGPGALDPHIWLDPMRMATVAATVAGALTEILPSKKTEIERNLGALERALAATDARVAAILDGLSGRSMVVFHPAYGYFARRYGLHQVAVEAEGKAPSARQLASTVDTLRTESVTAIFIQPQFSRIAADRVAAALGCQVVELDPLAGDYLANLEEMARRIAAALGS
jgi:zinc transport system substrate-binding protein